MLRRCLQRAGALLGRQSQVALLAYCPYQQWWRSMPAQALAVPCRLRLSFHGSWTPPHSHVSAELGVQPSTAVPCQQSAVSAAGTCSSERAAAGLRWASSLVRDGLKFYKPTTDSESQSIGGQTHASPLDRLVQRSKCWSCAGMRHRVTTSREGLWRGKPFKALTQGMAKTGGRNNHGHICTWHRGGGHRSGPGLRNARRTKCCLRL